MTTTAQLHVIFGAGQVGSLLAQALLNRGLAVRLVRRSPQQSSHPLLQVCGADAYDPAQAKAAAAGAAVVYQCTNAPYHQWPTHLSRLVLNIADAAQAAGAKLVVLDNLYMLGTLPAGPFAEDQPEQPCSKKGLIRKQIADELRARQRRGELQVVFGRAPDFWGPGVEQGAIQHPRLIDQLLRGAPLDVMASPTVVHSYAFVPDVAEGLAILGTRAAADGRVWHLPVLPAQSSLAHLQALAQALGQPLKTRVMPRWLLQVIGWFSPLMREMPEMMYQFDAPMQVDSTAFCREFGVEPTPFAEQVRQTATWIKDRGPAAVSPA
jgi:nucleoside-diphosphate-sugar epimerase